MISDHPRLKKTSASLLKKPRPNCAKVSTSSQLIRAIWNQLRLRMMSLTDWMARSLSWSSKRKNRNSWSECWRLEWESSRRSLTVLRSISGSQSKMRVVWFKIDEVHRWTSFQSLKFKLKLFSQRFRACCNKTTTCSLCHRWTKVMTREDIRCGFRRAWWIEWLPAIWMRHSERPWGASTRWTIWKHSHRKTNRRQSGWSIKWSTPNRSQSTCTTVGWRSTSGVYDRQLISQAGLPKALLDLTQVYHSLKDEEKFVVQTWHNLKFI